jgi:DNA-binding IclR family transcriptional regulator
VDAPSDGPHSNSAARAIAIIEFLATRPTETFSVSEVARRVSLNKSTAYTLLRTLHRAGWAFRSPVDLQYGIGPTLIVIGEAAAQALPEVSFARPVMQGLASEFHRECVLSTVVGEEIVVLHTTGPAELGSPWSRPGSRTPCSPPFGTVFVAWQDQPSQKQWYERGTVVSAERFEELEADLEMIRARGFVATMATTVESQIAQLVRDMGDKVTAKDLGRIREMRLSRLAPMEYLVGTDESVGSFMIDQFQAPIFDRESARYALTIRGINEEMDLATLSEAGGRVRAACDEVTRAIVELNQDAHGQPDTAR